VAWAQGSVLSTSALKRKRIARWFFEEQTWGRPPGEGWYSRVNPRRASWILALLAVPFSFLPRPRDRGGSPLLQAAWSIPGKAGAEACDATGSRWIPRFRVLVEVG